MNILINFIAFQLGWFACVLGGAYGWPWAGTGLAMIIVALHLARAQDPAPELALIALAALLGAAFDSLLVTLGWLSYASGTLVQGTAPHLMVALWMLFATTLNVTLRWLKGRWALGAMLGAVAGPLAYLAGHKLGALEFVNPPNGLIALAVGWGLLMPALIALSVRFDGMTTARWANQPT